MPSKTTKKAAAAAVALPSIPKELLDQIVTGPMTAVMNLALRRHRDARARLFDGETELSLVA